MARMIVVLAAAVLVAAPAWAVVGPKLALVERSPLVVRGSGFVPRERVVLRGVGLRLAVRTTVRGSFAAMVGPRDRCTLGRIVAVGTTGDRVVLRLPPLECAPATAP
jgi:hypothetical protein